MWRFTKSQFTVMKTAVFSLQKISSHGSQNPSTLSGCGKASNAGTCKSLQCAMVIPMICVSSKCEKAAAQDSGPRSHDWCPHQHLLNHSALQSVHNDLVGHSHQKLRKESGAKECTGSKGKEFRDILVVVHKNGSLILAQSLMQFHVLSSFVFSFCVKESMCQQTFKCACAPVFWSQRGTCGKPCCCFSNTLC